MAYAIPGQMITLPASTTILSTTAADFQFRCVGANASGEATLPSSDEPAILGVLQNKPTVSGAAASIMIDGVTKVQAAGSTVATGDLVAASSNGMVKAVIAGAYTIGRILGGSSGSTGRILTMSIEPIGTT